MDFQECGQKIGALLSCFENVRKGVVLLIEARHQSSIETASVIFWPLLSLVEATKVKKDQLDSKGYEGSAGN